MEKENMLNWDELHHSIASFFVMIIPVTVTMLMASLLVVHVQNPNTAEMESYLVFTPSSASSATSHVEHAILNALVIACSVLCSTFIIVACYRYNCTKCLVGYMIFSSGMLLSFFGSFFFYTLIVQEHLTCDYLSFFIMMYNFAIVGVLAIYYQKVFK